VRGLLPRGTSDPARRGPEACGGGCAAGLAPRHVRGREQPEEEEGRGEKGRKEKGKERRKEEKKKKKKKKIGKENRKRNGKKV
jgi:hypothetical protein